MYTGNRRRRSYRESLLLVHISTGIQKSQPTYTYMILRTGLHAFKLSKNHCIADFPENYENDRVVARSKEKERVDMVCNQGRRSNHVRLGTSAAPYQPREHATLTSLPS